MKINGKTDCGKIVIGDVYLLSESFGVPLDLILHYFKSNNFIVDWIDFYHGAKKNGASDKSIFSKIEEALSQTYEKNYKDSVLKKIKNYAVGEDHDR